MIPVTQTIFEPPDGDCHAACIASILELPLSSVPNPTGDKWYLEWDAWLREHFGLEQLFFPAGDFQPGGYAIATVPSPSGNSWNHSVVTLGGKVVWNPNPIFPTLECGPISEWVIFYVVDASKIIPAGIERQAIIV